MIKNSPFKIKRKLNKNGTNSKLGASFKIEEIKSGKQYENFYNLVKRRINSF